MPIYEYECEACGRYEVMQRITEDALKTCEKCGKPVRRLVSETSFALKGSGWYKDLYSSSKSSSPGTNSKSESSTKPSDAKPEAKPEPKPEPKKAENKNQSSAAA
jgi:putative FmdB family regulatory protein